MPPQPKATGLAKKAAAESSLAILCPMFDPNAEYKAKLQECIKRIEGHRVFGKNIRTMDPLPLEQGFMAPYDALVCEEKKKKKETYLCGINALWADPMRSPSPRVPIMDSAVEDMAKVFMKDGPVIQQDERMDLAFPSNPMTPSDEAVRCSPEEPQHALIFAISQRIEEKADEKELKAWKRLVLSFPGCFLALEGEEAIYFHLTNSRLKPAARAKAVTHKTLQLIFDIMEFKRMMEAPGKPLSNADIAALYASKLNTEAEDKKQSRTSPSTIEAALNVANNILKHASLRDLILRCERRWLQESPFQGIYKLQELSKACKHSVSRMLWVMSLTELRVLAGHMASSDFTVRNFNQRGSRQWVDLFLKQLEMKNWLLTTCLDGKNLPAEIKLKVREIFKSPTSYVEQLRPISEAANVDLSWQAAWPSSALSFIELVEQASFNLQGGDDHMVRLGLKNAKAAHEIIQEYSPFKETLQAVDEHLESEMKAAREKLSAAVVVADDDADPGSGGQGAASSAMGAPTKTMSVQLHLFFFIPDWIPGDVVQESEEMMQSAESDETVRQQQHVQRLMKSYIVLEVEEGKTVTELAASLAKHAAVKVEGASDGRGGNVLIAFDVNTYGEALTAPHVRRAPLPKAMLQKLFQSVEIARHGTNTGEVSEGEVYAVLNGGRIDNSCFSKLLGTGLLCDELVL